jgi:hypothetical protein
MVGPNEIERFYRQSLKTPVPVAELLDGLHVYKAVFNFEPVYHGWG